MPIRVLDAVVAAQIAAGEIIERPASVIRELVENAIDAGARRIVVDSTGGGLRELRVSDDGAGIAAAQVETAFARHATSKLQAADDLLAIATLGFRGEALPAIAAVAQVICSTRTADAAAGTEVRLAGGEVQHIAPIGVAPGTTFVVRNLFYNLPVRREFLRSEAGEQAQIATLVAQYALMYPEIRFTLTLDGRAALQTSGDGDLRTAVVAVYGLDVARRLLPVQTTLGGGRDALTIAGLIAPPGLTRSARNAFHLFVNRRAVAARGAIAAVVEEAYTTMLLPGRHPLVVLGLMLDPAAVDVNIHPTKSEVRFRDPSYVYSGLGRAVRDTLAEAGATALWQPPDEQIGRRFALSRAGGVPAAEAWQPPAWDQGAAEVPAFPADLRVVGQLTRSYILAEAHDGLLLVDQQAAHERVLYERLLAGVAGELIDSVALEPPQVLTVAMQELHALWPALAQLGLVISGTPAALVAIPAGLDPALAADVLGELAHHTRAGAAGLHAPARLRMIAAHGAIRVHTALDHAALEDLLHALAACAEPQICPHGRPTCMRLSHAQIEQQLGRG